MSEEHINYKVFVSYSRVHSNLVGPIVDLMRITQTPVFRDEDSIPHGKLWRPLIVEAIESAAAVVVFWCIHASESSEVKREYKRALSLQKVTVPILLDSTPMPAALAKYNGIDFRPLLATHAESGLNFKKTTAESEGRKRRGGVGDKDSRKKEKENVKESTVRDSDGHIVGKDYTTTKDDGSSKTEHYAAHSTLFGSVTTEKTGTTYNKPDGTSKNYKEYFYESSRDADADKIHLFADAILDKLRGLSNGSQSET